ncbi:MAG: thioredoxin family protein [Actinomycetota bacterium]
MTLLYFDGCANATIARDRLVEALRRAHLEDSHLTLRRITSLEEAMAVGFPGSPSVLIDGRDLFGDESPVGVYACRVYETPSGTQGAPSVAQLVDALTGAAAGGGKSA